MTNHEAVERLRKIIEDSTECGGCIYLTSAGAGAIVQGISAICRLDKAVTDIKELPEFMDYLNDHEMEVYISAIDHAVQVLKGDERV